MDWFLDKFDSEEDDSPEQAVNQIQDETVQNARNFDPSMLVGDPIFSNSSGEDSEDSPDESPIIRTIDQKSMNKKSFEFRLTRKKVLQDKSFMMSLNTSSIGNPQKVQNNLNQEGHILEIISNSVYLIAPLYGEKLYFSICVENEENALKGSLYQFEAFGSSQYETHIRKDDKFKSIHDIIVTKDQQFSEKCPFLHILIYDSFYSHYVKMKVKLSKTIFQVVYNGEFVKKNLFKKEEQDWECECVIEGDFIGPEYLNSISSNTEFEDEKKLVDLDSKKIQRRLKQYQRTRRAMSNLRLLTPFGNREYFLGTCNFNNFAVFHFNKGKRVKKLKDSEFSIDYKQLRSILQVSDYEIILIMAEGSIKRIGVEIEEQKIQLKEGLLSEFFVNYFDKPPEEVYSRGPTNKLLQSLAKLEFCFDQKISSDPQVYGQFSPQDFYLQEDDITSYQNGPKSWRTTKRLNSRISTAKQSSPFLVKSRWSRSSSGSKKL